MSYHEFSTPEGPVFNKTWIVEAKWAHPLWHSYVFLLYDIATPISGVDAPVHHKPGVTHELMVFALDPAHPVEPMFKVLTPANHGYQFKAESDEAATARVVALLEEIEAKQLSPDTDFRTMWDVRFSDGVSLHMKGGAA